MYRTENSTTSSYNISHLFQGFIIYGVHLGQKQPIIEYVEVEKECVVDKCEPEILTEYVTEYYPIEDGKCQEELSRIIGENESIALRSEGLQIEINTLIDLKA